MFNMKEETKQKIIESIFVIEKDEPNAYYEKREFKSVLNRIISKINYIFKNFLNYIKLLKLHKFI